MTRRIRRFLFSLFLLTNLLAVAQSWEWTDILDHLPPLDTTGNMESAATLSLAQVSDMRVRDIKWRLARSHGYSAEELAKMLLKKELVQALALEEEKVRLQQADDLYRALFWRSVILAIICVAVVMCWPLLQQGFEVAMVNFVVYTDRKKLEAQRCWELQTKWGMLGVTLMFIIDLLQAWLTVSILLSWVMRSNKYFFPTPNIPIRPAQLMGGPMEKAFGGYGINIGSMLVTSGLRFAHGQIERWTGQALSAAMREQKKKKKKKGKTSDAELDQQEEAARQSRREARRQARQAAAQQAAAAASPPNPPADLPPNFMDPNQKAEAQAAARNIPTSTAHDEFMEQLRSNDTSGLDELD